MTANANHKQEAFKTIVDKFTPKNWHNACSSNLDKPAFPEKDETAGY
jgi:acid phosphatase